MGNYSAADYNFTTLAQGVSPGPGQFGFTVPGGALSAGVSATATLTPVPPGVNHTDVDHWLYISNGTGTAEAVKITGGTAVAGMASGTIEFTPYNGHSDAFTLSSATAGIQEALIAATQFSTVFLSGQLDVYATIKVPSFVNILGEGRSTRVNQHGTFDVFLVDGTGSADIYSFIRDFTIKQAVAGDPSAGSGIHLLGRSNGLIEGIQIYGLHDGIVSEGSVLMSYSNLQISTYHYGLWFKQNIVYTDGYSCQLTNISIDQLDSAAPACVRIEPGSTGLVFTNFVFQQAAVSVDFGGDSGFINEVVFDGGFLDNYGQIGVNLNPTAASSNLIQISNTRIAGSGTNAYGVLAQSSLPIHNVLLKNVKIVADFGVVNKGGAGWVIDGCEISPVHDAHGYAVTIEQSADITQVTRMRILNSALGWSSDKMDSGIRNQCGIYTDAYAHSNIEVRNCALTGSVENIAWNVTAGGNVFTDNVGIDDVIPTVASAATLDWPLNPIFVITGTTAVTAVAGAITTLAAGARGFLTTTDGSVSFTAGTTIGNSGSTTQNVPVPWFWNGAKAWLAF